MRGSRRRGWKPRGHWSEGRIRSLLAPLLSDRQTFPTYRELNAAHYGLGEAIRRYGGPRYWAEEFGLELRSAQDRHTYTVEDAVREAREVLRELGYLPGPRKLREMGRPRLATQLHYHGGARSFQRVRRRELFG